jgi:glyoxylate reductase
MTGPPPLYLSRMLPDPVMSALEARYRLTARPTPASPDAMALRAGLRDAEYAICTLSERIDADVLRHAPRLRIIANYAVGYNNIDILAARAKGIVVTNTPDVLTETTADLAWALLLATARRVVEGHELVKSGRWTGWDPIQLLGAEVSGRTLGIVGMGRIGRAVARRAAGFGMSILYVPRPHSDASELPPLGRPAALPELLASSDFISLHVPLRRETVHLIGKAELHQVRPSAILINTSRGPVVDEAALVTALEQGRLAGAGLDVYEREPVPHSGLLALRQVVLLPHVGSATLATRVRMGMVCLENLDAMREGRPIPNQVG